LVPDTITAEHIRWSTPVPGRGHSSPVIAGEQIFLTTADVKEGTQAVLSFNRSTGQANWTQVIHRGGLPTENHPKNTEASSTLAYDGESLFAVFYNASALVLTALSLDGEVRWQKNLGPYDPQLYKYGYASSPLLYKDFVIVVGDYERQPFLVACNRSTGEEVWRGVRPLTMSFSSPIIAHTSGRDQLLLSGGNVVISYNPDSGEILWRANATSMATCGTMVWNETMVFASGGFPKAETAGIRSDGSGEVVWRNNQKCYEQSMLVVNDYVYAVTDAGIAYCWRATDGETMWRERLGGAYSSSPILVGDVIHVFNEAGQGFAFRADPAQYVALGQSKFADDVFATPAVVGSTMFMRVARNEAGSRQEYLLAISAES
jgi:outer membrane protein assembly factor BamB